jgi:hypothetical protein
MKKHPFSYEKIAENARKSNRTPEFPGLGVSRATVSASFFFLFFFLIKIYCEFYYFFKKRIANIYYFKIKIADFMIILYI